jgi:hypothetical protein
MASLEGSTEKGIQTMRCLRFSENYNCSSSAIRFDVYTKGLKRQEAMRSGSVRSVEEWTGCRVAEHASKARSVVEVSIALKRKGYL